MNRASSQSSLRSTVSFSITDRIGALDEVLQIIKSHRINLARIESRPSKTADWDYDFFIDLISPDQDLIDQVANALKPVVKKVKVVGDTVKSMIRYFIVTKPG